MLLYISTVRKKVITAQIYYLIYLNSAQTLKLTGYAYWKHDLSG